MTPGSSGLTSVADLAQSEPRRDDWIA